MNEPNILNEVVRLKNLGLMLVEEATLLEKKLSSFQKGASQKGIEKKAASAVAKRRLKVLNPTK